MTYTPYLICLRRMKACKYDLEVERLLPILDQDTKSLRMDSPRSLRADATSMFVSHNSGGYRYWGNQRTCDELRVFCDAVGMGGYSRLHHGQASIAELNVIRCVSIDYLRRLMHNLPPVVSRSITYEG